MKLKYKPIIMAVVVGLYGFVADKVESRNVIFNFILVFILISIVDSLIEKYRNKHKEKSNNSRMFQQ